MDSKTVLENVRQVSADFAAERGERQKRRNLDRADFDRLRDAGFLLTGVPVEQGGLWDGVARSTRSYCEILRALAKGDPSVALVSSMHPAVLVFWLATPEADAPHADAWKAQRQHVAQLALDGAWWGTITSEPGSGGDLAKTKAIARADGDGYRLSGAKHFGSGSGISSYMITSALADGVPDLFYLDTKDVPWDGSTGMKLIAEWDGHGMAATQSHSMMFEDFPATRSAWPGTLLRIFAGAGPYVAASFTAVIVGVVDAAMEAARAALGPKHESLRPYEQVEWTRAELDAWLIAQAYEGMLRAIEEGREPLRNGLLAKTAIAELAESATARLCKVIGGGTFNRTSPFGFWYEDVRALGFLRPPWGLAYDQLFMSAWPAA
jgi:alkylation response protein AidB-like acyl-CoA dehydrogenase